MRRIYSFVQLNPGGADVARAAKIDEKALTKGEIRKLNALRKSIGDELGEKAFREWLSKKPEKTLGPAADKNASAVAEAVEKLIADGDIGSIRRGGYTVRRGRGRVIVEPATD